MTRKKDDKKVLPRKGTKTIKIRSPKGLQDVKEHLPQWAEDQDPLNRLGYIIKVAQRVAKEELGLSENFKLPSPLDLFSFPKGTPTKEVLQEHKVKPSDGKPLRNDHVHYSFISLPNLPEKAQVALEMIFRAENVLSLVDDNKNIKAILKEHQAAIANAFWLGDLIEEDLIGYAERDLEHLKKMAYERGEILEGEGEKTRAAVVEEALEMLNEGIPKHEIADRVARKVLVGPKRKRRNPDPQHVRKILRESEHYKNALNKK